MNLSDYQVQLMAQVKGMTAQEIHDLTVKQADRARMRVQAQSPGAVWHEDDIGVTWMWTDDGILFLGGFSPSHGRWYTGKNLREEWAAASHPIELCEDSHG